MSFRLPPPPSFTLPPPPMPPVNMFDSKIVSQLTCSLIRHHHQQQQQMTNSRLILIGSALVISAILLFIVSLAWLLASRRRYEHSNNSKLSSPPPVISIDAMNDLSTCSSRSYETISSEHTGIYLESVDTSATTCSTDPNSIFCYECHCEHGLQPAPYYHMVEMPDVLPS